MFTKLCFWIVHELQLRYNIIFILIKFLIVGIRVCNVCTVILNRKKIIWNVVILTYYITFLRAFKILKQ